MDKEEFLKTTSRIICNEGCGKLAKKVIAALKAELGEPLAADVREFDFGTACEVSIRGHEGCFGYRSRLEDGTHSSRTPEDFARMVAKRLMPNASLGITGDDMTRRCKCEHWQDCPTCAPQRFDADGKRKPPEPTPLQACRAELETMREALALHEVGSAYAHRLAVMLECALLDPTGTWNEAHALLDEYRAACRAAAPMQEPPTFMGEPVVMPNAKITGG